MYLRHWASDNTDCGQYFRLGAESMCTENKPQSSSLIHLGSLTVLFDSLWSQNTYVVRIRICVYFRNPNQESYSCIIATYSESMILVVRFFEILLILKPVIYDELSVYSRVYLYRPGPSPSPHPFHTHITYTHTTFALTSPNAQNLHTSFFSL